MKVVSHFRLHEVRWSMPEQDQAALRAEFPSLDLVSVEADEAIARELADAEVFLGWTFPREHFAAARRLRWVQSASAGVELNLFPEMIESDVVLTNGGGLHSVSIPEHTLALMLALARNVHHAVRLQGQRRWERFGVIGFAGGVRELSGACVAILGAGPIGLALVALTRALGMRVRVLRRRAGQPVPGAEAVVGPERLHELLAWADFVLLATPSTAETRHLIDRDALAAMKSSAFLVNVGRGEVIDDDALVDALRRGAIAGAGLDAFVEEPLPPTSPYFDLENVILTPHVSGYTPTYFARVLELFRDNLGRWLRGETLRNVVNKRLGYVEA